MKNKKLFLKIALTTIFFAIMGNATYASVFTPLRPYKQYVQQMRGYAYPSFNNFKYASNDPYDKAGDLRNNDEREFLLIKNCTDNTCDDDLFYDSIDLKNAKEGDIVEFETYFHNNGEDAYDGDQGSPDATDVSIGIDVSNRTTIFGYIFANNNQYRENENDQTSIIKYKSGDYIFESNGKTGDNAKTASDTATISNLPSDMYLEVIPNYSILYMAYGPKTNQEESNSPDDFSADNLHTFYFNKVSQTLSPVTIKTVSPSNITINVKEVKYSDTKIGIYFDKLPGCYRYSGYATFHAIVKERPEIPEMPECIDLGLTTPVPELTINGERAFELKTTMNFKDDIIPAGSSIYMTTEDKDAKVFVRFPNGNYLAVEKSVDERPEAFFRYTTNQKENTFYYVGTKKLNITVANSGPLNINLRNCVNDFTPPSLPDAPICDELKINSRLPLEESTQTEMSAKSLDTRANLFNEQITYKVDEGFGFFATEKCEELRDNTNTERIEFVSTHNSASNPKIFNTKKLQANSLLALSVSDKMDLIKNRKITSPLPLSQKFSTQNSELQTKQSYIIDQLENREPGKVSPSIQTVKERCNGQTEITVSPETKVYFYALKGSNGQNVVHINTNDTSVDDCERHFPIGNKPPAPEMPECIDLELNSQSTQINGLSGLKLTPIHTFEPRFTRGVDDLPKVYTRWTTTDGLGKFYTKVNNQFVEQSNNFTQYADILSITNAGKAYIFTEVYYLGENPLTKTVTLKAETYDSENNLFVPCVQTITLNPAPEIPVCVELNTYDYFNTESPELLRSLESGKVYILTNDTRYEGNIENTKTIYTSSEGAFLEIRIPSADPELPPSMLMASLLINTYKELGNSLVASGFTKEIAETANMNETITVNDGSFVLFITYENAEESLNALTVKAFNRTEPACEKSYPLTKELLCLDLDVIDWSIPTIPTSLRSPLKENTLYELSSLITMSKPSGLVQTRYVSNQGAFLVVPEIPSSSPVPTILRDTLTINTFKQIAMDIQQSGISSNNHGNLPRSVTVNSNQTVFFITFVDAVSSNTALIVEYAPGGFADCIKTFSLQKAPEIKECLELKIIRPSGNWDFDDLNSENEQRFEVEVVTNPLSYANEIEYRWTVRPQSSGTWSRGQTSSEKNNTLEDIEEEDEPRVIIQAYDKNTKADLPYCRATLDYDYEETPPEIKKFVYDIKGESFKKLINIGGKATEEQASWLSKWLDKDFQFVNYLIEFTPGSSKSAEIYEQFMDDGAIEGSLKGNLDYEGLAILVETKDSKNLYAIYISEDFDQNRYLNERIGKEKITEYLNFQRSTNYFEDKYSCENANSSVVCIANDFDDIEKDFKNGEKITLGNLNKAEKIYIIVQTENNTTINDDRCKELTTTEGCGEEFDNTIHFDGSRKPLDRDYRLQDDEYEGKDSAKVIVLCPYIITRQGGDVFFRDVLDTGIDVNYCSEVKGGEVVIKEREDKPLTPSTGADDEDNIVYKLPTGDICKLSNTEISEIAEYQNVLKNFSSSICEMEAEVSTLWKEENINKAIKSNIEKLARFGKVSGNVVLNSINDLSLKGFGNTQSGVFVIENGNLDLGDGINPYRISKTGNVPAYQTYIVVNGDININNNILYDDSGVNPSEPKSFPSAAFIVINGNINISNSVNQIDGILMAIAEDENSGQIKSLEARPTFDNLLTINGSLIGDVYDLFFNRRAIGDPLKDQGSITVRYDQRVLLNTPEGLNQLIDVNQLRTAN